MPARSYPESGVKTPFHSCSHHGEVPSRVAEFAKLNRYHVGMMPYFLEKLRATPDGDGNLLDHSLVLVWKPDGRFECAQSQARSDVPLAGHANGKLKGNLHVREKDGTPMSNILLTVMHKLGVEVESIGDSTGEVAI